MCSRPDTFKPATPKELAALPVGRNVGAQLGVGNQSVLVPRKRGNLLIHVRQWGRFASVGKTRCLCRSFQGRSNGNFDTNAGRGGALCLAPGVGERGTYDLDSCQLLGHTW